nr:hypothetical protein BaRGS_020645 [Batillaria attramentaria]
MEIDRTVTPSARATSPPENSEPKEHKRARKRNFLVFDTIAKYALQGYLFTITATWYLGMFEVMPVLYRDSGDEVLFLQRCFVTLIFVEANVNWLGIRYVDSSYFSYLRNKSRRMKASCGEVGQSNVSTADLSPAVPESRELRGANSDLKSDNGAQNGTEAESHRFHGDRGHSGQGGSVINMGQGETEKNVKSPDSDWKPVFNPPQQSSYPYWSWIPCYICEVMRPPRCHHCPVCQTCVLKRDHHCYFAGSCVGWRNQRHFIFFLIWVGVGAIYATAHSILFFRQELWEGMSAWDLLAPVCIVRWMFGFVSGLTCICVTVQTLLVYFILLILGFIHEHVMLISSGMTSFEVESLKSTVQIRDTRTLGGKFRATLGRHWLVNLVLPMHWVWEAEEDPENWPSVKVFRHGRKHTATRH